MASIRVIRRRIRGIRNIVKITKAMQMIAASKMRRAQEHGLAGRPYADKIHQVIADLAAIPVEEPHPLLRRRPVRKITVVHITPDRGLCGGLNSNLNRLTGTLVVEHQDEKQIPVTIISVGRRGFDFMRRYGCTIQAEFSKLGDQPRLFQTLPISRIIIDDYTTAATDLVYVAYARFVSATVQKPVLEQILPVEPAVIPGAQNVDFIYEPESHMVLDALLPRFVEMSIYHAILESIASEQSARMVAMKNATDNGNELIGDLTLLYNKARQETITKELLDISGGAAALT